MIEILHRQHRVRVHADRRERDRCYVTIQIAMGSALWWSARNIDVPDGECHQAELSELQIGKEWVDAIVEKRASINSARSLPAISAEILA